MPIRRPRPHVLVTAAAACAGLEALEPRVLLAADATVPPGSGDAASEPVLRQAENLDRGVVAIHRGSGSVYVGWRMLGLDPADIGFNVYRALGTAAPVKVNAQPVTTSTNLLDNGVNLAAGVTYTVRPVVAGVEGAVGGSFTLPPNAPAQPFLRVPLNVPAGGTTPTGEAYTYSANDASVGDVDGDGQYEIILKWDPSNAKDNSQSGYTGNVYLDAYELDGTQLWRIDLGRNIRARRALHPVHRLRPRRRRPRRGRDEDRPGHHRRPGQPRAPG
jgi:hypothetical protein